MRRSDTRSNDDFKLPIIGEGFLLRDFTLDDVVSLAEIEFDSDVKQFLAMPEKVKSDWIQDFNPEYSSGWAVDVNGILAGGGSLTKARRLGDAELAIVIAHSFCGMGLGKKVASLLIQVAFNKLKAKALIAIVHPDNKASIALLRAFKFRRRGKLLNPSHKWQQDHFIYRLTHNTFIGFK